MKITELEVTSNNSYLYSETTSKQEFLFDYHLRFSSKDTFKNYDEAIEGLINFYLREKGLDETVQSLIYDKYPDLNI